MEAVTLELLFLGFGEGFGVNVCIPNVGERYELVIAEDSAIHDDRVLKLEYLTG
jgi:hypothetical protein